MNSQSDPQALQEKVMFLERDLEILGEQMIDVWKRIDAVERKVENLTERLHALGRDREGEATGAD